MKGVVCSRSRNDRVSRMIEIVDVRCVDLTGSAAEEWMHILQQIIMQREMHPS